MLARTFGCVRIVFNDALRLCQEEYQTNGTWRNSRLRAAAEEARTRLETEQPSLFTGEGIPVP